jgi:hypothetical protein
VTVTKNASSAQRSTIDTSRTVLVWIVSLATGAEHLDPLQTPLQLIGFVLLVSGTLVYNEIVVIHYWGFDQNTKAAIAKREKQAGLLEGREVLRTTDADEDGTYMAQSPHAAYDAARQKRKVQMKLEEMRLEGGLNKSEITVDEQAARVNLSVPYRPTSNTEE